MSSKVAVRSGQCYWCRERDADSREHKFKRSDLVREHGRGELRGGRTIVGYRGGDSRDIRSTKSNALKFRPSLCAYCNNTRSQSIDLAYDRFIEGVLANEQKVLKERQIDLKAILGNDWRDGGNDVLRYFVKHALCRLVESHRGNGDVELPADALAFLDGGPVPQSFSCEFWIEPTWLRFCEKGEGDPLWVRPMAMEPLFPGPNGRVGSRWAYGWLVFGWEFWGEDSGHPFGERLVDSPIVATKSVDLEFALVPSTMRYLENEEYDRDWMQRVVGDDVIAPDHTLSRSPVGQAFAGGALDFEAATRGLGPDRREPMIEDPVAGVETEIRRAGLLAAIARSVWAEGSIDVARIRAIELDPAQLDLTVVRAEVVPLEGIKGDQGWEAVYKGFAGMSSLKLIEALQLGVESEEGDEALRLAASFAGNCAVAAGAAGEDGPLTWDSVCAAVARIARVI